MKDTFEVPSMMTKEDVTMMILSAIDFDMSVTKVFYKKATV